MWSICCPCFGGKDPLASFANYQRNEMLTEGADFVRHSTSFGGLRTSKSAVRIHLSLDAHSLEWRGKLDKTKDKGYLALATVQSCIQEEDHKIVLLDYSHKRVLVLEADTREDRDEWAKALKDLVKEWVARTKEEREDAKQEQEIAQSQYDIQQKAQRMKANIEKKKKEAEKKKKKLGNVGMKHTAEAMMRGTPAASSA